MPPEENKALQGDNLLEHIIRSAMKGLKKNGRAQETDCKTVKIHPEGRRIFGTGSESIYCFYDPRDRENAEKQGKYRWPCNIGKTKRDVIIRVEEKTDQWTVEPRIDLILKTSQSAVLERKIHNLLKALGRHLKKGFKGKGREWYSVHPEEVIYLYRVIQRFKYSHIYLNKK